MFTVMHGDCLDDMRHLHDETVSSVVTDPPYRLSFMGKEWDTFTPEEFQVWCHQWALECFRVLKPGAFLLAFGGTRTYHRLAVAIEDAGFDIRDSLVWINGQGFPKSLNVSKAIDKQAGAEREVIGTKPGKGGENLNQVVRKAGNDSDDARGLGAYGVGAKQITVDIPVTAPATTDAKQWEGWGTALKPAYEPIVMARKPLAAKTVASNVLEHGTGAINIDGCRIETDEAIACHNGTNNPRVAMSGGWYDEYQPGDAGKFTQTAGRWPANVLLSHTHDCGWWPGTCAEGCPVAELDRQSGQSTSRVQPRTERRGGSATDFAMSTSGQTHADSGGASRFFYCAKAPKSERPAVEGVTPHVSVKPLALMRWLVRLVTSPGGLVLDPFAGTGATAEACELEGFDSISIERDAGYIKLINQRMSKYREAAA